MFARFSIPNLYKFVSPKFDRLTLCSKSSNCNWKIGGNRWKTTASDERVVITDDGSTIVCWHPEKKFPYEFSRPIPIQEVKPSNTVLKIENKSEIYKVFKSQDPEFTRQELMKLTYTSKHRWFPNNTRFKKTYKRIKSDREWL